MPPLDFEHLHPWFYAAGAALVVILAALLAHRVGGAVLRRLTRGRVVASTLVARAERPARVVLPLAALQLLWQALADEMPAVGGVRHLNGLLLIAALTWLAMRLVRASAEGIVRLHPADGDDNLAARKIQTQVRVLARTVMVVILIVGLSMMLMTFPGVRQVGASLLASAGVAGIVAGIAARPVMSNLIAGLQLALSQPIRLDDVLVIQGEWGRVEEITGSYVVLKIWDERRLIVPLQWFIENPFQNWTRSSAQIIGTVFLWVDYRMPLEPLRQAAQRACEAAPEWDRRLCLLQVTDTSERAMQLRLLVTSADSGRNWDLRCRVREALVDLMQREYPQFLPTQRVALDGEAPSASEPDAPSPGPAVR